MIGENNLSKNMTYYALYLDDPTIQHLRLDESPELNYASSEVSGIGVTHNTNKVTIKDIFCVWLIIYMWIQSVWCKLPQIYIINISNFLVTSKEIKNKKTDYNTMCGNPLSI